MKTYFAYGSNLVVAQMKMRCPHHRIKGKGILRNYRWIISQRGYATVVRSEEDEVHGVIFDISPSDEEALDRYEGVGSGCYRKEILPVEFMGQTVPCLVYIDPIIEEGNATQQYIERINRAIVDADLPSSYVKKYIRRFVPASVNHGNKQDAQHNGP